MNTYIVLKENLVQVIVKFIRIGIVTMPVLDLPCLFFSENPFSKSDIILTDSFDIQLRI